MEEDGAGVAFAVNAVVDDDRDADVCNEDIVDGDASLAEADEEELLGIASDNNSNGSL
jgi:hypothetical protein